MRVSAGLFILNLVKTFLKQLLFVIGLGLFSIFIFSAPKIQAAETFAGFYYNGTNINGSVNGKEYTFKKSTGTLYINETNYNSPTKTGTKYELTLDTVGGSTGTVKATTYNGNLVDLDYITADVTIAGKAGTTASATTKKAAAAATASSTASAGITIGTIFGKACSDYNCWINAAWNWVATVSIPAAATVIMIAGVIYATSSGNPDKIGQAKKMIFAALSGIIILLLAKIFLVFFLGVDSAWNIT